jgi:hypothetical protein
MLVSADGCTSKRSVANFDKDFSALSAWSENHDGRLELRSRSIRGNSLIHEIFTFLKPG